MKINPNNDKNQMHKLILLFITVLVCNSCTNKKRDKLPINLTGKVIGVLDGDTIDILYDGKPLRIRLAHIDCPEIRQQQPYARDAKQFTSKHCFGQIVRILHSNSFDRSKRLIGEVITNKGNNLNKDLVKAGLAWHYKKYSNSTEYNELEQNARAALKGLWSNPNPTPPWEWRRPRKPEITTYSINNVLSVFHISKNELLKSSINYPSVISMFCIDNDI